jgi:catechol 2,3-dioxygenase-like lactoylglutathione lyase family enzyme
MKMLGMAHTCLTVSDRDRSVAFYRDILGMDLVTQLESSGRSVDNIIGTSGVELKVAFLKAGEDTLELHEYVSPTGRPYDCKSWDVGLCHIAFRVADLDEAYRILLAKGLQFRSEPQVFNVEGSEFRACYTSDPDGIPVVEFEGDQCDTRFYSDVQTDCAIEALIETMASRRQTG